MGQFWDEVKSALGFSAKSGGGRQTAEIALPVRTLQPGGTAAADTSMATAPEAALSALTQTAAPEEVGLLNARKHLFGPHPAVRTNPPVFDGILNEDLHEWKTFKTGILNADRYQWSLPEILNATKHGWRKRPVH